ncbi:MAG: radical SAM protein [Nannocystaceae bacterium]
MSLKETRRRLPIVDALPRSGNRYFSQRKAAQRPAPTYAVWELTLACDQRCSACGPRAGKARSDELSTAEALDVVEQLAQMGVGEVTLIGGEAYLRDDVLFVIRRIRERGMKATMTTGGLTLTRARAEALVEAGIELVSVSIDGLEATHDALRGTKGGWRRAIEALRHVKACGARIAANTQINRQTMGELVALGRVLADEGIEAWQMFLTIAHGNAADHPQMLLQPYMLVEVYEELERVLDLCDARGVRFWPGNNLGYFGPLEGRLRRNQNADAHYQGCQAGRTGLGIESDGRLKSCPSLGGPANTGGNLRQRSLVQMWDEAPQMRALGRRTVEDLWGYCRECYYAQTCLAGCTATTEPLFGRPGNNPFCHHRVLELRGRGLRERLVQAEAAPDEPFGMGRFDLIVEPIEPDAAKPNSP